MAAKVWSNNLGILTKQLGRDDLAQEAKQAKQAVKEYQILMDAGMH
ncbi:MAG: hypothetical protein AAGN35_20375 [Bacteroidota bacterium]